MIEHIGCMIYSASAILNTPYVRNNIELFIKDREYLLQQKIISLKGKAGSGSSRSAETSPTPRSKSVRSRLAK